MDNSTDDYKAGLAGLAKQTRAVAAEVDAFLNGDHSHMSEEEHRRMQDILLAKQQDAIQALVAAMGMRQEQPLMQSEDVDIADIRRRAGITERKD
jgi:hypothetical protein